MNRIIPMPVSYTAIVWPNIARSAGLRPDQIDYDQKMECRTCGKYLADDPFIWMIIRDDDRDDDYRFWKLSVRCMSCLPQP